MHNNMFETLTVVELAERVVAKGYRSLIALVGAIRRVAVRVAVNAVVAPHSGVGPHVSVVGRPSVLRCGTSRH